jgi:hypothetical protein
MIKPPRTALPLPRYVERRPLKSGGWGHFFHVPSKYKRNGCPLHDEPLGLDYDAAVKRAETILLPAFDAWLSGDTKTATMPAVAAVGTLDWVFAEYRADRRYKKLDAGTKRNHENGFKLVGGYELKDGTRLGSRRVGLIDTGITDALYEALLPLKNDKGEAIGERRTTVNHAMKSCRRAWNICARRHPGKLSIVNPFAKMGLESSDRETPTATAEELKAFRAKAKAMGLPSLAIGALIGWEWLQRGTDIFATFDVAHYRPKDRKSTPTWCAWSMRKPGMCHGFRCSMTMACRCIPN